VNVNFDQERRKILKAAVAWAAATAIPLELWALAEDEELVDFADLVNYKTESRAATPRVKFFDLRRLTSFYTPSSEFFEFHQTEAPQIKARDWRLHVTGFVEKPREFTLDEIRQRADKRDVAVTIECSGNTPINAANGQVSTGLWSGVSLASVLNECVLKPEAREVVFLGLDIERERTAAVETPHGRSVFVQDALDPDAILAFALNGQPLSPQHGFPLRVILPGWYGMTQIKWLGEIRVMDRRYEGPHMSRNYHRVEGGDLVTEMSISKKRLKSVIARVTRRKDASGRYRYKIAGAAWSGAPPVKSVEVSIDNKSWRPAVLGEKHGDYSWTLWSLDWDDAAAGPHTLVSRAIDMAGGVQPTAVEFRETVKTLREDNSQWVRRIVIS
jgi:DMSO/TMAO reductase YedYZ molybdopterin-dependent catalytic subunit